MTKRRTKAVAPQERPRVMMRYEFPEGCDVDSVVIQEIRNRDKLEIALWVDAHHPTSDADVTGRFMAVQYETTRYSLVQVDDQPVNQHGAAYMEMDNWNQKTMHAMTRFFDEVNGIDEVAVEKAVGAGKLWSPTPIVMEESEDAQRTSA